MIEFVDVVASRGSRAVLRDVSLSVGDGEVVALVGRSGSGKTTMLRLVNRMLEFNGGDVRVGRQSVLQWDAIQLRRRTGYVIQEVGLFPHLTVAQNVAVVPRLLGWDEARSSRRTEELLTLVGLEPLQFAERRPDELSGGQRQRVGLARALAADPPVLLMDEPFGALDPITRADMHREFRALQHAMPRTVLLVTHDVAEAFALADRVAVLHEGVIIGCGTPHELEQSTEPTVAALLRTRFG